MNYNDMPMLGHVTVSLLAIGFSVFFWMIYKKVRKVVKRARKQKRRLSDK